MNRQEILAELTAQRDRLNQAIEALGGAPHARRRRPPKPAQSAPAAPTKRRRTMSAAARARIGAAKKAWWVKQKGKVEQG